VYRRETDGAARAWLYRARSLDAAGVPVAAASDAPVIGPDPWLGMAAARTLRTRDGATLGAGERVDAATALAFATTNAAASLRAPRLGRLVPGAPADLIVVPRTSPRAAAVRRTTVRLDDRRTDRWRAWTVRLIASRSVAPSRS
jgi:predicted amidohydrolase YtcJ